MNKTGNFRTRNIRRYELEQQRSRFIKSSCDLRNQTRPVPIIENQSNIYKSALVFDNRTKRQQILYEHNIDCKREIASLTKIMTCFTVIQFIAQNQLVPEDLLCQVSKQAADLKGTNAGLEQGDIISLWDLLYGLMLPSGNDSAYCIAENIGKLIKSNDKQKLGQSPPKIRRKQFSFRNKNNTEHECVARFIEQMNKNAKKYGMLNTQYHNPHGLSDHLNFSTCRDQLKLIHQCLKHKIFRKIVGTKLYFGCVRSKGEIWTREIIWENTNRLLYQGYQGVKTGHTTPAGYCLASWYQTENIDLIVIILGCKSRQERDFQTLRLTKLIQNKQNQ